MDHMVFFVQAFFAVAILVINLLGLLANIRNRQFRQELLEYYQEQAERLGESPEETRSTVERWQEGIRKGKVNGYLTFCFGLIVSIILAIAAVKNF